MYIDRVVIARILETKASNVRKASKDNETICVQLWNSKEKVYIPIGDYNSFIVELKKNPNFGVLENTKNSTSNKSNQSNQSNFGILLMIIGALVLMSGYAKDTTVSTSYGSVNNIGLMNDKQNQIQLGGISFIAGILLYCLDKKDTNSSK